MAESANTLFHFTGIDSLKNILKSGFYPKYRRENLSVATPRISEFNEAYVPMVCFCDLPLSRIREHIEFYGEYGIGMRKDGWGLEWGISPIIYLPSASRSSIHFQEIAIEIGKNISGAKAKTAIKKQLQNFYKYIKPYNGKVYHKVKRRRIPVIFYHEREWRYVPEHFPVISKKNIAKKIIERENELMKTKEHILNFKPKDVKYIVVRTEGEIKHFATFIRKELKDVFSNEEERNLLISKLISAKQIKEDM